MAGNFLQAALELLDRPGNAVRGAVIDGPQGALQGITGQRQFDSTELPGINQLPDQGLSLGPLNLTPRTVGGFAAGAALDPLSYVGGAGIAHAGEGLGRGLELLDRIAPAEVAHASTGMAGRIPTSDSLLASLGKAGLDAQTSPVEDIVNHLNANHNTNLSVVADSPEAAESAVAQQTGSEAGSHAATSVSLRAGGPRPNIPPDADATPVGDQRYAQAKDRLGQTQAQLGELNGKAIPARQWLTETSTGTVDKPAQSWEDVVGVRRGTSPDDPAVLRAQENPPAAAQRTMRNESTPDMSQGPGLTSKYNGETVGFSRQEVMNHLANLESQIQELGHTLAGDKGSRFGDPLAKRGMDNTLSDWQAKRQLAGTPELQTQREGLMRSSTSSLPGLSPKQETLAYKKAGAQQLSQDESFRRAPDARYYNREQGQILGDDGQMYARHASGPDDEANIPMRERDTRAPHGDPLEEDRARKESQDKFGRRSAGTYGQDDDLGHIDYQRGPGAGGVRGQYESGDVGTGVGQDAAGRFQPGEAPVHVTGTRASEPTAGVGQRAEGPNGERVYSPEEAQQQLAIQRIRTEALLNEIRQLAARPMRSAPGPTSPVNRFLGYIQHGPPH